MEKGPLGATYSIIGFNQSEHVYGEKVMACEGGPFASAVCAVDSDCGAGGTCTGETTLGVGFPQDLRNCLKCHTDGATAASHRELPSTAACTGCHDDVNPSLMETAAGPPGFGHAVGAQEEAACRNCHRAEGLEFGISVAGAHTIPERSQQLAGLEAEILAAFAEPSQPAVIDFRITDGDGTAITDLSAAGLDRVAIAVSGPTLDLGAFEPPAIRPTVLGFGSSGTLLGPDAQGVFTYETADTLPADAYGTWRVGLEARREVVLNDSHGNPSVEVTEAVQNPVLEFSVDGSPLLSRREVVADDNCGRCHGEFSRGFNIHGSLRNQSDYCVVCHNANGTDFARRRIAVGAEMASVVNEPIALKHLLHKIHTGEELHFKPYIVYGFGTAGFTPHDFSEIRFPGNRADCATCHVGDSNLLPLPDGLLPTIQSIVSGGVELVTGEVPVIQDACLSCHDSAAARVHAATQTSSSGEEACVTCHGEGASYSVSEVHERHLVLPTIPQTRP